MHDRSTIITWLLHGWTLYSLVGFFFALYFVWRGASRLDEAAYGASRLTRAIWFPAAMMLWPVWWSLLRHLKHHKP